MLEAPDHKVFLLDRAVYERHKSTPTLLDLYLNLGRREKVGSFVPYIERRRAETGEQTVTDTTAPELQGVSVAAGGEQATDVTGEKNKSNRN